VLSWLTIAILVAAAVLLLVAAFYAVVDRLVDDRLLLVAAVLELALVVQAVVALVNLGGVPGDGGDRATFAAYAVTLPLVPPALALLAIKEKTRWSMGVVAAGAFAITVMTARLEQIWVLGG
jgi:hypothetical protein